MFATIPYLVVVYEDGKEKQCNFKYEDRWTYFFHGSKQDFPQIENSQSCSGSPHGRRRRN